MSSDRDVNYDIDVYKDQVFQRTQQMVHDSVKSVFVWHDALRVRTSLLTPRAKHFEELEHAVSMMDHSSALVSLPYDLRIPFARYVARKGVLQMKRFDVDYVNRVNKFLGHIPKKFTSAFSTMLRLCLSS